MKKVLLAMMAFLPMCSNAQKPLDDWEYNDSTEYVYTPKMVTDTTAVEKFANECRAKWRLRIDSLSKEKDLLNTICGYSDKKLPEEYLPVCSKYLEWIKGIAVMNPSRYSNWYRVESQYVNDPKYRGLLDIEKSEKQLSKGKLYPQMGGFLGVVIAKDIDPLIKKSQDSIDMDIFYTYNRVANQRTYPQRQIQIPEKNKNYRPAIFMQYRDNSHPTDEIGRMDKKLLSRGWEWVNDGSFDNIYESYPVKYDYRKYKSHPEYKVRNERWFFQVYDKDGNLVYIPYLDQSLGYGDIRDLVDYLLLLEYRKDYEANKYNIKSEGQDVQYSLRNHLGYSNEANQKAGKAFVKSAVADYESKKGTWQKRYNARLEAEKQAENYIYESIKANHPTAVNFLNQLKKDHEQDYKYLYKIKRIGDTSFALQFVTYDMKPKCDIYISYFTAEPNNCGHQVDKIVTY